MISESINNDDESQEEKDCYKQAKEYEDNQEFDKAIEILEKTLKKFPNNANLLNTLSIQYCFLGENLEKALEIINKAISIEPDAACYNTRALIYERLEKFEEALLDHNEAVKQAPDWFQARFDRAVYLTYIPENKINDAMKDINEAIKIKPEAIEAYQLRAKIYEINNEYSKAINDYEYIINNMDDVALRDKCMERISELKNK